MTKDTKVFDLMTNSSIFAIKNCQNVFFNTPPNTCKQFNLILGKN